MAQVWAGAAHPLPQLSTVGAVHEAFSVLKGRRTETMVGSSLSVKAGHNQEMFILLPFLSISCLICTELGLFWWFRF
jgi:hypothetical protein